jgi:putative FmdB family regulatory protein
VPIYEFRCGACGERFEALVDAGTETVECRLCGSLATRADSKGRFNESRRPAREGRG